MEVVTEGWISLINAILYGFFPFNVCITQYWSFNYCCCKVYVLCPTQLFIQFYLNCHPKFRGLLLQEGNQCQTENVHVLLLCCHQAFWYPWYCRKTPCFAVCVFHNELCTRSALCPLSTLQCPVQWHAQCTVQC